MKALTLASALASTLAAAQIVIASAALAEPPTTVTVKDSFDNVTFSVNNAAAAIPAVSAATIATASPR